ncbi:hypothetical protein BpHYR1_023172 [Brachionus plicatilis]|uniref:Snake toxin/toxin-like domain-containing protein n=1 Tax=Brachionus plicatilis TaxID=10195 RepID=A0A3M7Q1X2_BRAPC|nr:hypothetical protein BpHYR1_023172 [Brachionus plicatilis]
MKSIVFLLNISLLLSLSPTSNGLQCYECAVCLGLGTLKTCDSGETYCQRKFIILKEEEKKRKGRSEEEERKEIDEKILAVVADIEIVSKSCVSSCTEVNTPIVLGYGGGIYCCNTDGCNFGISIGSSIHN